MFSLTNSPSTRAEKMSVPVIDTSQYTESQLNALPGEIARKNRVARLAAAMKALHEQTMRNMDAELMEEDVVDQTKDDFFNDDNHTNNAELVFHSEIGGTSVSRQRNQQQNPSSLSSALKFHAVGWNPHQFTSESRQRRRAELFISPTGSRLHNNDSPSPSKNRVVPSSSSLTPHPGGVRANDHDDGDDVLITSRNQTNNKTTAQGSWALSASRQRQKLQTVIKKQQDSNKRLDSKMSTSLSQQRQQQQEKEDEIVNAQQRENNNSTSAATNSIIRAMEEGDTEAERFRNASVQLRNINLKLKVMFEKRYRARLDDNYDAEDQAEEKRRKQEVQDILKREAEIEKRKKKKKQKKMEIKQKILDSKYDQEELEKGEKVNRQHLTLDDISTDEEDKNDQLDDDDDFFNGDNKEQNSGDDVLHSLSGTTVRPRAKNNANLSMQLEQKERELAEATRQWRQSALDAELLTGELLRAQATIERYKIFMEDMTSENEKLRAEVDLLKRELLTQKTRNAHDGLGKYASFRRSNSQASLKNASSFKSTNSIEDYVDGLTKRDVSSSPLNTNKRKVHHNEVLAESAATVASSSSNSKNSPIKQHHQQHTIVSALKKSSNTTTNNNNTSQQHLTPTNVSPGMASISEEEANEVVRSISGSPKQVSFRIETTATYENVKDDDEDNNEEEVASKEKDPTETTSRGEFKLE